MERIIINESDLTSNSAAISSYDVAYVPGFAAGGDPSLRNIPTLVTTIYQFRELFGSAPATFDEDQYYPVATEVDRGFPEYAIPDYANLANPYIEVEGASSDERNFTIQDVAGMIAIDGRNISPVAEHWFEVTGTEESPVFTLSSASAVLTKVSSPSGNPSQKKYYEIFDTTEEGESLFRLSLDTSVDSEKDYYELSTTKFAMSLSPRIQQWYVQSSSEYYLAIEDYIVPNTTYYRLSEDSTPAWFKAGSRDIGYRYAELLLKNGLAIYYEAFNSDQMEEVDLQKDSAGTVTDQRNPRKEGWYELDGEDYVLTQDITCQDKVYFRDEKPSVKLFYEKLANRVSEVTDPGFDNIGDYSIKYITSGGYPTFEYGRKTTSAIGGTQTSNFISDAMISLAAERQDAVALIDHTDNPNRPLGAAVKTSVYNCSKALFGNLNATTASYGAMFTPWYENGLMDGTMMPASAAFLTALAAQLRYTNPWLAVSGVSRGVVPYLNKLHTTQTLTNNIADSYQSNEESTPGEDGARISINAITYIRNYGYCLWGNRTLRNNANGTKATSFLNIRNQVSDIKKQLYAASQRLLFEQNTDVLWINFKSLITPMLEKMVSNSILTTYKITKLDVDPETGQQVPAYKILAVIKIYPINSVEVFDLTVEIDNNDLTIAEEIQL